VLRPGCLARVVVGLVFLISGLAKMWVPGPFPAAVWRLVPVKAFHPVVVLGLPVLEVVLGLLLVSGLWQREVLRLVLVLAFLFCGGAPCCNCGAAGKRTVRVFWFAAGD